MDFLNSKLFKTHILSNLFDIDEYILQLSNYIPDGQGWDAEMIKSNIKRIYFTFEIEKTKGAGIKYKGGTEKIVSEKFYNNNKAFFNANNKNIKLATSLNYNHFISLDPLIEIINNYPALFEKEPFEFVDLFNEELVDTLDAVSKSMALERLIKKLDRSYILLENLIHDSLISLNIIQKEVIRRCLYFNKEVFRLLLIKFLPLFELCFSQYNYASVEFEKLLKKAIKTKLPKNKKGKIDYGKGFKIDSQPPTNYKMAFGLLKDDFINENTNYSCFQNLFSTLKERDIEKQIVWRGSKTSLHYFISKLKNERNIINKERYNKNVWKITEKAFLYYNDDKETVEQMTNIKQNSISKISKSDKDKLDKIIDCF